MGSLENSNISGGLSGVLRNPRGEKTETPPRSPRGTNPDSDRFHGINDAQNPTNPTGRPNRYVDESGAVDHWRMVGDWMDTVGDMVTDMQATFHALEEAHGETQRRIEAARETTEEIRRRVDSIGDSIPGDTLGEFRKLREIVEVLSDELDANTREVFRLGDIVEPDADGIEAAT